MMKKLQKINVTKKHAHKAVKAKWIGK